MSDDAVYELVCEEPFWTKTRFNVQDSPREGSGKQIVAKEESPETIDIVEGMRKWYWIESTGREEVLKVPNFIDGERIVMELSQSSKDFEDFVESDNAVEIVEKGDIY